MLKNRRSAATGMAGALVVLLTGCAASSAQQRHLPAPADVVATVGSTSITLAQVDEKALQQSTGNFGAMKLAQALFEARRIAAEELIEDELLAQDAKTRKLDQATLIQREITAKVAEPTEAEAALWYQQNQSRLQGASLEVVSPPAAHAGRASEISGRFASEDCDPHRARAAAAGHRES